MCSMVQHERRKRYLWCLTELADPLHRQPRRMRRAFSTLRILPVANIGRFYGGEGGGEGGAGAGGSGNGSGNPGAGDQAAGVTEEKANELINKALSARFRDFEQKQSKNLDERFGPLNGTLATLTETVGALATPITEPKGKSGAADPTQTPEYKAQEKRIKQLEDSIKVGQEKERAATAKARSATLLTTVKAELEAAGVKATGPAAGYIIDTLRAAGYEDDDSEKIVYRVDGEPQMLKVGIAEFLKTDEGKLYLPARQASGSGDLGAGGGVRRGSLSSSGQAPAAPSRALIGEALLAVSGMQPRQ